LQSSEQKKVRIVGIGKRTLGGSMFTLLHVSIGSCFGLALYKGLLRFFLFRCKAMEQCVAAVCMRFVQHMCCLWLRRDLHLAYTHRRKVE